MSSPSDKTIKITAEDLASVPTPQAGAVPAPPPAPNARVYGTVAETAEQLVTVPAERGSILLQGWFYLGLAGLLGALAGWAIAEPGFIDDGRHSAWGNILLIPLIITLMCIGFGISESAVERSVRKALLRGALALPLGILLGFIFNIIAETVYAVLMGLAYEAGAQTHRNPAVWIGRGIAWAAFGAAGGVVYGIVGQSMKKGTYGVIGGAIGAGIGGIIFDPIVMVTHVGWVSRAVGFALVGLATGVGMGLVESALKDRWLYVVAGPLAGKQFILYKNQTSLGSLQDCDIYLFKDPVILPRHALVSMSGSRVSIQATGPVFCAGQSVNNRVLQDGDLLHIGRYAFRYKERHRS